MLKWFRKLLKDEKGFTLIELMVVVVIIGILAAIAVPAFSNSSDKAKVSKAKADLRTLESALAVYYAENNFYPNSLNDLVTGKYIKRLPKDPWDNDYVYSISSGSYNLYSKGSDEDDDNGEAGDINSRDL
ncbi:type II secretion system protein GspG [Zhaonella formicivorans]|uniref:type II secretion system protein GspG n=1 Tax=Zhaonella formicivorans TaxID=2528593 RepID=UPI0010D20D78|nr:type II secretion system protein GspG [Zhaonella formicivorans]